MNINELSFLVMSAVADEPRHGYGILQELRAFDVGTASPQVATLYRTIDRLVEQGCLIEHGSEVVDGRFRRTYRLTDDGVAVLTAETERRLATATIARRRLQLGALRPGQIGGSA